MKRHKTHLQFDSRDLRDSRDCKCILHCFWGIFWKGFVSFMINPKKKLTHWRFQGSNLHSADLCLCNPHVISRWQLLNKGKGMHGSFQQTLRSPKSVCIGGYRFLQKILPMVRYKPVTFSLRLPLIRTSRSTQRSRSAKYPLYRAELRWLGNCESLYKHDACWEITLQRGFWLDKKNL